MIPSVLCLTPTYGRPHLLQEMLWCWVRDTYPNKQLLIVNDQPNVILTCDIKGVKIVNVPERFMALGAKRNYMRTLIPDDINYVVTMDDDDLFTENHVERLVTALDGNKTYIRSKSHRTHVTEDNVYGFINETWPCYGASCFRAAEFKSFWMQDIYAWGEDTDMLQRHNVTTLPVPGGSFIYRRGLGVVHASGHEGMVVADPMHQAMVNQRIQTAAPQFDEPTEISLHPKISNDALALYQYVQRLESP